MVQEMDTVLIPDEFRSDRPSNAIRVDSDLLPRVSVGGIVLPRNIYNELCKSSQGTQFLRLDFRACNDARAELEARWGRHLVERQDLRMLTTPAADKERPIYNWFSYKEAFSSDLVARLLRHTHTPPGAMILDPFGGVGTVALVCREGGFSAASLDLSPLAVFIACAKLSAMGCDFGTQLICFTEEMIRTLDEKGGRNSLIDVTIWQKGFDPEVAHWLSSAVSYLDDVRNGSIPLEVVNLAHLALLSIAAEVSHTVKDGTSLRLRLPGRRIGRAGIHKTPRDAIDLLRTRVAQMADDLRSAHSGLLRIADAGQQTVWARLGDARDLLMLLPASSVDRIITSPPYPNRYDYTSIYALELLLGFVKNREELRDLRFKLLCSHLEAPWPESIKSPHPVVGEILTSFLHHGINSNRNFKMVLGYFEDMRRTLDGISKVIRPGGQACIVVGNVRIEGECVPVDLLLADIAHSQGLQVTEILVTRYKGTNSQQTKRFGAGRTRESIVCLRRP